MTKSRIAIVLYSNDLTSLRHNYLLVSLARELNRAGFDCDILGYYDLGWFKRVTRNPSSLYLRVFNLAQHVAFARPITKIRLFYENVNFGSYILKHDITFIITSWYYSAIANLAKKWDIKFIFWDMDSPMVSSNKWAEYIRQADQVFTYSRGAVKYYDELGVKAEWLPLAYDPEVFFRLPTARKSFDLLFAGGYLRDREEGCRTILYPLVERFKKRLKIIGYSWEKNKHVQGADVQPSLPVYKLNEFYNRSKVCLNIHRDQARKTELSFNSRTFEVLGSGSFLLSDYVARTESVFELGKELVVARTPEEAVELGQYYLDNSYEREKIAKAGHDKIIKEHTIGHRASKIAETLRYM